MKYPIRLVFFAILLVCSMGVMAQNDDCEVTINRALEEFNAGHFYVIPGVLDPCINQYTTEQRQRVYLLLTQTYLLLDDPISARQSYLNILKANPEFTADTSLHPIDVIYLSKKFTSTAVFSWLGKVGTSTSFTRPIYEQSTVGDRVFSSKDDIKFGYQIMAGVDFSFLERFSLRGEINYSMVNFGNTSKNFFTLDSKTVIERQNWLSVPISLLYSDRYGRFRPYGYVGYSYNFLISDKANISITNDKPSSSSADMMVREKTTDESPELDLLFKRNRFNQSIVLGGGVKMKVGLDFVFVDVRYAMGMRNVVNRKNVYADYSVADLTSEEFTASMEASTRYMQGEDYFRLDNLSISVGFLRPLYKPRELKRARTKSVMRQLDN
jgi:opacity protein-like surface antigen